ncbi:hypothetical protein [Comamonas sp.]
MKVLCFWRWCLFIKNAQLFAGVADREIVRIFLRPAHMLLVSPGSPDSAHAHHERSSMFQMPVFKPGVQVMQGGRKETVSHVVLRRREMMVYLIGKDEPVKPERLSLVPTWFTTKRRPETLNWYL